jgi:hypothetical protein
MHKDRWLNDFEVNVTSQNGEDGIITKIFEFIPYPDKWCVEFGAWDGKFLSNCYNLLANKSWKGVMIEAQKKKYKELIRTFSGNKEVYCINKFVNFEGPGSLDEILNNTPIPQDFDLLSIDIDGNDYHVWNSLHTYRPKVVIIEYNHSIPSDIEFIQKKNNSVNHGSSLLSLTRLAKTKKYELVCTTLCNAIYVDEKYFKLFNIEDNSINVLFKPHYETPRIFQLYDGTLMLTSEFRLFWKSPMVVKPKDLQVIPKYLRFKNDSGVSKIRRLLFRIFLMLKGQ